MNLDDLSNQTRKPTAEVSTKMVDRQFSFHALLVYLTLWAVVAAAFGVLIRAGASTHIGVIISVPIVIVLPGVLIGGLFGFLVRGRKWIFHGALTGMCLWILFGALLPAFQVARD